MKVLLAFYFILLIYKLGSLPLFVGDEAVYVSSVESLISGVVNNNNHPLLAKEIWAFFVYLVRGYFGIESAIVWRIGTVFISLGSLFIFFKILKEIFSNNLAILGTALLAFDPMYFSFSRIVMLDVIALFFNLTSLFFFIRFLKSRSSRYIVTGALFMGLSLAVKMGALVLVLVLPIYLVFSVKKAKDIKTIINFISFVILGFSLGNFLYFLLPHKISLASYVYEIFSSQIKISPGVGYLSSSPVSWFLIPQILTLFRVVYKDAVASVFAFQNPIFFLLSIPAILTTLVLLIKGAIKKTKETSLVLIFFLAQYLPWFSNLHPTYYFYILPLIPLIIILCLQIAALTKIKTLLFASFLVISVAIFSLYYPLLIGLNVSRKYENTLFSYSRYEFPPRNVIFCQLCSPR